MPANPQSKMMRIGPRRYTFWAMKAKQKRKMLRQKRQGFSLIELKFSLFIKSKAAANNRPTTAGRKALKTFSTEE